MTEEILTDLDIDEQTEEVQRTEQRKVRGIRGAYIIGFIFFTISIASDITNFLEFGAWQILAESLGDMASLVLVLISFRHYRRGDKPSATSLFPYLVLTTYTFGELFISGSLVNNLFSGLLLMWIIFFVFDMEDGRRWVQFSIIHSVAVLFFAAMGFIPKFYLDLGTTNTVITAGFTILLIVQLVRRFEIRSIQIRLLLIMLGLGLTPIIVIGAASTLIDLQRDTTQAEGFLSTFSSLEEGQIDAWVSGIYDDLDTLRRDDYFSSNLEFLTQFSPTEEYLQQINDLILADFRELRSTSPEYNSISVVSADGEILISTNTTLVGNSIVGTGTFSSQITEFTFDIPSIEIVDTTATVRVYLPFINDQGTLLGFVMSEVSLGEIEGYLQESLPQLGETGDVYLVNENYQLLTPLRNNLEYSPGMILDIVIDEEMSELTTDGAGALLYPNYAGVNVLGIQTEIPALNAILILEQNQDEAYEYLRLSVLINVIIGIFTLIISISLSVVVSRNFTAPIEQISEVARRVFRGERETFPETDRADEIGTLTNTLGQMTSQLLATTINLEETVTERTAVLERRANYLETTSRISHATTGIYDLTSLLNTVAQLISENFGFYHVGIFINDDLDEYAELRASNSEGGWKMLARGHKLKVGAQGIVGYVTGTGEARVQQQVSGEDSVYFDNPDLPLTRSEMALPLRAGEEIFGALDVQSNEEQAFTDEDVAVLQTLADTVSVSIQNARLVEELRENLEAERRLFGEITKQTWTNMLTKGQKDFSVRSDSRGTQLVTAPSTKVGKLAMKEQMAIIGNLDEELQAYPAALPVTVRGGATIGVIETQKPEPEGPWTQEEISILENVSSELGLALDNARLFEETQRRAQRDRIAAELSTKIWASPDMENILQTAVSELGSALNVSRGQIKLSMPEGSPSEEAEPETPAADQTETIIDGENQS